jgi:hypothetical protein
MQAELQDLSKMLAEVDQLAADMDADAAEAAAVVECYCSQPGGSEVNGARAGQQALHTMYSVHWEEDVRKHQSAAGADVVQHMGSFKHSGSGGVDGLLGLQQAVLEAAALGSEADALSRSLEGLGGVLSAAANGAAYG